MGGSPAAVRTAPRTAPRAGPRVGRVVWVLAVTVTALVLGGCGIPVSGAAKAIPKSAVPFHLLDPATTSTTGPPVAPAVGAAETIFLVAPDQHVVPVSRDVRVPANLSDVLGALLEGPTATESADGLQTFLVAGSRADVTATVTGGVATVDFAVDPVNVDVVGPDQTLAIAQVVYTATQQPGVKSVAIQIAGHPTGVPVASGAQVPGPVNRFDYLPQAPLS